MSYRCHSSGFVPFYLATHLLENSYGFDLWIANCNTSVKMESLD